MGFIKLIHINSWIKNSWSKSPSMKRVAKVKTWNLTSGYFFYEVNWFPIYPPENGSVLSQHQIWKMTIEYNLGKKMWSMKQK